MQDTEKKSLVWILVAPEGGIPPDVSIVGFEQAGARRVSQHKMMKPKHVRRQRLLYGVHLKGEETGNRLGVKPRRFDCSEANDKSE